MSADVINLNVINKSNDANNSEILIFQKNVAPGFSEIAVAWKVIQNLGQDDNHPFKYPFELKVSANDSFGNFTPQFVANPGEAYAMVRNTSGDVLQLSGQASTPIDIDVKNQLEIGAIGANLYRDGRLMATKTGIAPGQKATFLFKPTIFIGVASQVVEGAVIDSAVLSTVNTQLSLLGISSADIVMSGGGPGKGSTAFEFSLQNVQFA